MFGKVLIFSILIALGKGDTRIISGTNSTNSGLIVSIQREHKHICAGAIYKSKYVITSASCMHSCLGKKCTSEQLEIRSDSNYNDMLGKISYVKSILCINDYDLDGNKNDFAVLEIDGFTTTKTVRLALKPVNENQTYSVYGWGESKNGGALSSVIKIGVVKSYGTTKCREELGTSMVGETVFCTNAVACKGDKGGPLMYGTDLYGIASDNTCGGDEPSIFTDVNSVAANIDKCVNSQ